MNKKKKFLIFIWSLLALICFGYGAFIASNATGTNFYMVWLGLGIIFVIFSIFVKISFWSKLPRFLKKLVILIFCLSFCFFSTVEGCIITGFFDKGEPNLDYIIVLGAQIYKSGPSSVLKNRLDKSVEYLEENPKTICIVTGGQGFNEPSTEAECMADYLINRGISEDRILLEDKSESTEENLKNSMEFIKTGKSIGIVTNNFHVFRALITAKQLKMTKICGISANTSILYIPNNMLREFFAIIKYFII